MTAPNPHPLASADLRIAHRWMEPCGSCDAGLPQGCTCPSGDVRSVISALVQEVEDWREMYAAGRLVPPDADTRQEFGVRMTYDDGTVTEDDCERSLADARVRFHAERRQTKPGWRVVKAELIERTWRVGPWLPVPTTPETP